MRAQIANETLNLLKTKNWHSISVSLISKKLKGKKILKIIKNKNDLLININHYFDDVLKNKVKKIEKSSNSDMLFEIIMMRFDLLNKYRLSILKIYYFYKKNPKNFLLILPSFINSFRMMAKSSNLEIRSIIGNFKAISIMIIYFSTFLTWVKDNSSSLEKTMTVLNSNIEKLNSLERLLKKNKCL